MGCPVKELSEASDALCNAIARATANAMEPFGEEPEQRVALALTAAIQSFYCLAGEIKISDLNKEDPIAKAVNLFIGGLAQLEPQTIQMMRNKAKMQ